MCVWSVLRKNSNKESIRIDVESVDWREVYRGEVKNQFNSMSKHCLSYWVLILASKYLLFISEFCRD